MIHETCYISANCNPTPTAAHWGQNNLICYASCNSILIYDPNFGSGGKVIDCLVSHTKRVNSVRWINGVNCENELISGSSDGSAIVWTWKRDKYIPFILKKDDNVNIVDGVYKGSNSENCVVVAASINSSVSIWNRPTITDEFCLLQTVKYSYSIAVGLKIALLPHSEQLILATALDNSKIELYIEENLNFELQTTLKGHEDWVRGLDFIANEKNLLLASSSQDSYIRIWRFSPINPTQKCEHRLTTLGNTYEITVDSVLTGHEGWIYSVNWGPNSQLLSASLDKSMILWELDATSNLWLEKIRVGEIGGNTLGFYGGYFSPDGQKIFAYSYHGAFHIWENKADNWQPCVTTGGHFSDVVDLVWEPASEFLLTISTDQTTRIHAPWSRNDNKLVTWHEISRPQIHGYDMSAIAVLTRYQFASAGEEKIIRTFEATNNFIENFHRICGISDEIKTVGAKGALVPSLGLSNKAVYNGIEKYGDKEESHFTEAVLTEPPTEENLLQNTLWPEMQKLYGHGYEVYCLATSPNGNFLASASKATTLQYAAILIWDTKQWQQLQKLESHTLTVVQMVFSPDSQRLLSVSRDRKWTVFRWNVSSNLFELESSVDKKNCLHTRIIWTCSWTCDSKYFLTGSRDGKLGLWGDRLSGNGWECVSHLEFKGESVTAVCVAPEILSNYYLIAIGFDNGIIQLYKWNNEWNKIFVLDQRWGHHLTVKKLAFRPILGLAGVRGNKNILQLASCSCDWSLRIHNFNLESL